MIVLDVEGSKAEEERIQRDYRIPSLRHLDHPPSQPTNPDLP